MFARTATRQLQHLLRQFPAVAVLGPRQSGKSTLVREIIQKQIGLPMFSCEDPDIRAWIQEDPRGFLAEQSEGAIIDEVQRCPELLSYLQGVIDADPRPGRWLLTGSAQLDLQSGITQSLAGRCAYLHLLPFTIAELGEQREPDLPAQVLKGGYPPLYDRPFEVSTWLQQYIATYLDRDLRHLSDIHKIDTFRQFIAICAGHCGQQTDWSKLGAGIGMSHTTVATWFSILRSSFIVFTVPPYHRNFRKRLLKKPKLYWWDTGLACRVLGITDRQQLLTHPAYGALCENWYISEIARHQLHLGQDRPLYFWRDQKGLEVDLLQELAPDRLALLECKAGQTISSSWFGNLHAFMELSSMDCQPSLAYGGDQRQRRQHTQVLPWHAIGTWPPGMA